MKQLTPGSVLVDVQGKTLTDEEAKRIQHPLVGGIILFARNYESPEQLCALTQQIRAARPGPLLIAVDHEGGRVQRFRDNGFTHLPSMQDLGKYYDTEPMLALRAATEIGYVLAAELRACDVDLSFAPVLDLDYQVSTVIGSRSFHRNPTVVTLLAKSVIQGMALAGMAACGKHFPGHGFVDADSHIAIPVDERELEDILNEDSMPYTWLGDMVLPAVMPAHVIYPKVDSKNAGFSKIWLQDILRQRLHYQGMIFSDDLTMEGASVAGNITDRAKAALSAGADMVLVCNRPDLADQLLSQLDIPINPDSTQRLLRLLPKQPFMSWPELQQYTRYQDARSYQAQIFFK
ncbi:beta-N-acetylhexosaminidase [Pelistega europaea]|uniref:Beta-hexosaminidase n=1 Tax=Pelistega europaea TaxID=106147 RepID=A0A7Y4L8E3_9BURK|nr:beta-N-acetylhexosaminidase [Pelistega europaea]NOL48880.1 beta-N-acetylhexosaminidase [Pelistega europaea]